MLWEIRINKLYKDNIEICELTQTEAIILDLLVRNPNKILSKDWLAEQSKRSKGYIQNIMSKLTNSYSGLPLPIVVIKGIGWMWVQEK